MKIHTIDSQVWWIALADEIRPTEGWDARAFLATIMQAFEFSEPPKLLSEGSGTELKGGIYKTAEAVVQITQLSLYNDGISVSVGGRTDVAEAILHSVLETAREAGVRAPISEPLQYCISTVVADLGASLDNLLPQSLVAKISAATTRNDAHFLSLALSPDRTRGFKPIPNVNPTSFSIGRRIDVAFDLNRYFSQASATTAAHLDIISEFERLAMM